MRQVNTELRQEINELRQVNTELRQRNRMISNIFRNSKEFFYKYIIIIIMILNLPMIYYCMVIIMTYFGIIIVPGVNIPGVGLQNSFF